MTDFAGVHIEQAQIAFDRGDLRESIDHYREAVRANPHDPYLHFNLAIALDGIGEAAGAGTEYQEAVRLEPMDERLHCGLGTYWVKAGQWEQAGGSFRRAAELKPGYPDALNGLAVALSRKAEASGEAHDLRDYLDATDQMILQFPEHLFWRENRSWALWQLGRGAEAVSVMESLIAQEPTTKRYSRLFWYQRRLGRWRDALRTLGAWWPWTLGAWWPYQFRRNLRLQDWKEAGSGEGQR